jgi:hypothetical protein
MEAKPLVPVAQYVRMSTEDQMKLRTMSFFARVRVYLCFTVQSNSLTTVRWPVR